MMASTEYGKERQVPQTNTSGVQQVLTRMGKRAVERVGCVLSNLFGRCAGKEIGILTYHRVAPWHGRSCAPTWNVTPTRFRTQLKGILSRGYRPWPLRQLLEFSREGKLIPRRTFVVTFDDGYENVYHHAWPVLRELKVPATVFLATAYLDSEDPFPFDDWPVAQQKQGAPGLWKPLSVGQCAEMLEDGLVDLGSHTHTHAVFRARPEMLYTELITSRDVLRTRFGLREAMFAFPFGITEPELVEAARQAGMLCSLTTENVLVKPGSDPFHWGRFGVEQSDSSTTLVAKLDGWYSLVRGVWQRWKKRWRGSREGVSQRNTAIVGDAN